MNGNATKGQEIVSTAAQQMFDMVLSQPYPNLQPLESREKNLQETLDGNG